MVDGGKVGIIVCADHIIQRGLDGFRDTVHDSLVLVFAHHIGDAAVLVDLAAVDLAIRDLLVDFLLGDVGGKVGGEGDGHIEKAFIHVDAADVA